MNALILVDIQNDFLPGGALAVPGGDKILPVVNVLLTYPFDLIVATKDYHPAHHVSFAETHNKKVGEVVSFDGVEQILWPVHCVQGTSGAEFSEKLNFDRPVEVFLKGTDPSIDSYSTFFDNGHKRGTGLDKFLRRNNVDKVFIAGLATDYCVRYSVLDALMLGFNTYVITDACSGVNLNPGDSSKALAEMQARGAVLITSDQVPLMLNRES